MENQLNFAERTKLMKETAFQLKNAADIVLAEVQHMAEFPKGTAGFGMNSKKI